MPDLHRLSLEFSIKKALERFVHRVEDSLSPYRRYKSIWRADHVPKESTEWVISCQLVVYETATATERYRVYDYCHDWKRYNTYHDNYFRSGENKSIVSIYSESCVQENRGFWKPNPCPEPARDEFRLEYHNHIADAKYTRFSSEMECEKEWNSWCALMFEIYPFCAGVYSDNFPIRLDTNLELHSALFVGLSKPLDLENLLELGRLSKHLLVEVARQDLIPQLYRGLQTQAMRSAISQVMARNMSHNIGSHVLSKFKDEKDLNGLFGIDLRKADRPRIPTPNLERVSVSEASRCDPPTSPEPANGLGVGSYGSGPSLDGSGGAGFISTKLGKELTQYSAEAHEQLYSPLKDANLPTHIANHTFEELVPTAQVAYFNEYLKNRMDFLADIATADPVMENPMFLYTDIFKGFDRNRILLNRISGISSEKFKYSVRLRLNGKEITKAGDPLISMTNDVLGAQAFYIILENLVRNIAKHSKFSDADKEKIWITVELQDYDTDPSYYEVSIFDNISRQEDKIAQIVCRRNAAFNSSILTKTDSTLRPSDLGTIEMDVCAAYMQRIPIAEVESDRYRLKFGHDPELNEDEICSDYRYDASKPYEVYNHRRLERQKNDERKTNYPKLMFAYAHQLKDTHGKDLIGEFSLGYKLYLKKPQEVLVLTRSLNDLPSIAGGSPGAFSAEELLSYGIRLITLDGMLSTPDVFNHQLLYLHSEFSNEEKEKLRRSISRLPKRWIEKFSSDEFDGPFDFLRRIWEKYVSENVLQNRKKIYLELDKGHIIQASNGRLEINTNSSLDAAGELSPRDIDPASDITRVFIDDHHYNWCPACADSNGNCEVAHPKKIDASTADPLLKVYPSKWDYYDMRVSHTRVERYASAITSKDINKRYRSSSYCGEIISAYVETVMTKVILLDERIQENIANPESPKEYASKVDFFSYFRKQKIVIPRSKSEAEPNLNIASFGNLSDESSEACKIKKFIDDHLGNAQFCVIHLGVLEKMLGTNAQKTKTDIHHLMLRIFENWKHRLRISPSSDCAFGDPSQICEVVITSGRGQPTNVPDWCSFVPIAPIQNAIETIFDKFVLTRILYSSRGLKNAS